MIRYFLLFFFIGMYSLGGQAADFTLGDCTFTGVTATNEITVDPVAAAIGDEIGFITFSGTIDNCTLGNVNEYQFALGEQRAFNSSSYCDSTYSPVKLATIGSDRCSANQGYGYVGPVLSKFYTVGGWPQTFTKRISWIKWSQIPPGISQVNMVNPSVVFGRLRNIGGGTGQWDRFVSPIDVPPGEIIGTTCSLASTNIPVDFGIISGAGAIKSFEIEFDSCTDQADATDYNDAVSLSFSSELIKPDGLALRNGACTNCARGIQIALQDGNGNPINLNTSYALASNSAVAISPTGLIYSFNAEIQPNKDEAASAGPIDAQLVFETVVE